MKSVIEIEIPNLNISGCGMQHTGMQSWQLKFDSIGADSGRYLVQSKA